MSIVSRKLGLGCSCLGLRVGRTRFSGGGGEPGPGWTTAQTRPGTSSSSCSETRRLQTVRLSPGQQTTTATTVTWRLLGGGFFLAGALAFLASLASCGLFLFLLILLLLFSLLLLLLFLLFGFPLGSLPLSFDHSCFRNHKLNFTVQILDLKTIFIKLNVVDFMFVLP